MTGEGIRKAIKKNKKQLEKQTKKEKLLRANVPGFVGITKASPHQTEQIKKNLCDVIGKHGLKITIEANKKFVNFLDVSLNLSLGTHAIQV